MIAASVFWGSLGFLLYTYLGFPLLLAVRAKLFPRPFRRAEDTPMVTILFAAYNEEAEIVNKLANLRALDYPAERINVVIASDGSTDETASCARAHADERTQVLDLPRGGKNAALNAALELATGDVVVFTDADAMLAPDALRNLVAPLADPEVGAVGGDFHYLVPGEDPARGLGERSYWSVDRSWKQMQSRAGSMTSATGQLHALRRELATPIPDGVMDDVVLSTSAIAVGLRLVFAADAVATSPTAPGEGVEFRRKVRNAILGLRAVAYRRALLNPFRHGFYALQLLSHKVLRRLLPVPLVALLASSAVLDGPVYRTALLVQLAMHTLALLGLVLHRTRLGRLKILRLPFFLDLVASAMAAAFVQLLFAPRTARWTPARQRREDVPGTLP